jgi:SAM-dependent methyltransferase
MLGDAQRWDERYAHRRTGEPSPPIGLDGVALPAGGRCLDVACGLGEQSLWAAGHGFDVLAIDASTVAVEALRAAAAERHLAIEAHVVDLDGGLPSSVAGACSLVICQRFRDPRLYGALAAALAPVGVLAITVLSQHGAEAPGPFHAPAGELLDAFGEGGLVIVRHDEAAGQATLVARRPG